MKKSFIYTLAILFGACVFAPNQLLAQCRVENLKLNSVRNSDDIVLTWDGCSDQDGYQVQVLWKNTLHHFTTQAPYLLLTPDFLGDDLNGQAIGFGVKQKESALTDTKNNCPTVASFRIHTVAQGERRKGNVIASIEDVYHPTEVSKLSNDCVEEGSVLAYIKTYPNPVGSSLTVRYALIDESTVTLSITDCTGRVIARLTDDELQQKGVYERTFDASNLPNGTYFYFMQAAQERTIGKLIKF